MTVDAWAKSWLSRPGKPANSRATDASALRTHILPALGARKLGSVTQSTSKSRGHHAGPSPFGHDRALALIAGIPVGRPATGRGSSVGAAG